MKRVLLPLALLGIVSLILLLFWWTGASTRDRAQTADGAADANPASHAALESSARELEGAADAAALGRAGADAREAAATSTPAHKLRGIVVAPEGCEDSEREVVALAGARGWNVVAAALDAEIGSDEDDDDAEDNEVVEAFGGGDDEERDEAQAEWKAGSSVLARVKAGADGKFELELPAGSVTAGKNGKRRVWLAVAGRFQYLAEAVEVDLDRDATPLELHATCGGVVRAIVRAPAGSDANALLAGEVARIGPALTGMTGDALRGRTVRRKAVLADGAFEFRGLPCESAYKVALTPERVAAVELEVPKPQPGRVTEVDLRVLAGGRVRGKVVAPDGTPVAGATVRAKTPGQWFGFDDTTVRRAKTDADGVFELEAVVPGKVTLRAKHKRFLGASSKPLRIVDGQSLDAGVLTLEDGASISGTVKWSDGAPAEGVEVLVRFDMSQMGGMGAMNALQGGAGNTITDEHGVFAVSGLGKGPFTVVATAAPRAQDATATPRASDVEPAPGDARAKDADAKKARTEKWQARRDTVAPGTKDLELLLAAPSGLRGRVVDDAGAPVTKFELFAQRNGTGVMATMGQAKERASFEDPNGAFFLGGLIAGSWTIHVTAAEFAQREPVTLELPGTDEELVLVLARAAHVFGVVKDPSGRPVEGADVEQQSDGPNWQRAMSGAPDGPKARTESGGVFDLGGLVPARVKLVARARGFAPSVPKEVDLTTTPVARDVEIVLRTGATLTGEVFDDAGRPAAHWMVQVTDTTTFSQEMSFTESDGRFRVEHLTPGNRQIVAMPSSAPRGADAGGDGDGLGEGADTAAEMTSFVSKLKMTTTTLVDGEETHVVLGAPPRAPVDITGTVTHAGAPYAGAMISFVNRGGQAKGMSGFKLTTVDARGEYKLTVPEPGEYSISIQKFGMTANQQGLVEFMRDIPEQKSARLDFELPTGRISGRVRGPDGNAAPGVRVSIHAESAGEAGTLWGGSYNESATDSEGRYDVQALKPGKYTVLAGGMSLGAQGGGEAALGRETKAGVALDAGTWAQDVDFKLQKPGAIDVTVVDENGQPVTGAGIFVRARGGELLDQFSMSVTAADGVCKYGGLSAGRYTVSARADARVSAESPEISVRSGERATARLVLARGTYLVLSVVDGENKPVQASVSVRDEAGREVGAVFTLADIMERFSGGAGSLDDQRVGPLPAGKYVVSATTSDGKTTKKSVSLNGQEERKLTVRF